MNIPSKIPIHRMEDEHTTHIGRCEDGRQFWGYETFVFDKPVANLHLDGWKNSRREYIVLHTFDYKGNHLGTKHWFAGTTANVDSVAALNKLESWVKELGKVELTDIEIKLFETVIDGFTFGLVQDIDSDSVELQPSSSISFQEPWEGEYEA